MVLYEQDYSYSAIFTSDPYVLYNALRSFGNIGILIDTCSESNSICGMYTRDYLAMDTRAALSRESRSASAVTSFEGNRC